MDSESQSFELELVRMRLLAHMELTTDLIGTLCLEIPGLIESVIAVYDASVEIAEKADGDKTDGDKK